MENQFGQFFLESLLVSEFIASCSRTLQAYFDNVEKLEIYEFYTSCTLAPIRVY